MGLPRAVRFALTLVGMAVVVVGMVAHAGPTPAPAAWAANTSSPRVGTVNDPQDAPVGKVCGGGVDQALVSVAQELATSLAAEGHLPDAQEIEWQQRKAGNPHVWARTFGAQVQGAKLDRAAIAKDVKTWLGAMAKRARCGVASVRTGSGVSSKEAMAVIAIDPVADLAVVPTHAKVGTWIDLDTTLLDGGTNGRVVLLPPIGAPKTILSSTSSGLQSHVKARFSLGTVGRHVVQVLADDGAGPRPMVEAEIWAGIDPPSVKPSSAVPGEDDGDGVSDLAEALLKRLNGARTAEKIPAIARDKTLEKVALAHANSMMKARLLGHDVGDGDPAARVAAVSPLKWNLIGENVAKAKTDKAAHRALYASPSHRANMLEGRFKKVGIAVVIDPKTFDLWVAQMYGG
jgi:uncharacterized protein YkwD